jgi:NAD(P)H-dependent FMN reductase
MPKLMVVTVSTRPQRVGVPVASWFAERAKEHGKFELDLVDLKELNLPLLDEPKHPRFRQYEHDHTRAWSSRVAEADAFVFVTPEYNHGAPAPLVNALDYLFHEWAYKPAAFVSYGGPAGGVRSVAMAKQILTTLKVVPIPESVVLPLVTQSLDDQGRLKATPGNERAAIDLLDELLRWSHALQMLR